MSIVVKAEMIKCLRIVINSTTTPFREEHVLQLEDELHIKYQNEENEQKEIVGKLKHIISKCIDSPSMIGIHCGPEDEPMVYMIRIKWLRSIIKLT